MSLLRALRQSGALRTLDDALAQSLRRLDPSTPDDVLAAAALASLAVAQGHAAFDPAQPRQFVDGDLPWPDAAEWLRVLQASRFVATPASTETESVAAPLVLEHGLLYLRRYREYERRLALGLQRIAAQSLEGDDSAIQPLFATLFPDAANGDLQARAAALALQRALVPRRSLPANPCRASGSPRRPDALPNAWRKACTAPRGNWRPRAPMPIWSLRCLPPPAPCIDCSAPSRIPRASATTPTIRCPATSWWWTKRRWSTCH